MVYTRQKYVLFFMWVADSSDKDWGNYSKRKPKYLTLRVLLETITLVLISSGRWIWLNKFHWKSRFSACGVFQKNWSDGNGILALISEILLILLLSPNFNDIFIFSLASRCAQFDISSKNKQEIRAGRRNLQCEELFQTGSLLFGAIVQRASNKIVSQNN